MRKFIKENFFEIRSLEKKMHNLILESINFMESKNIENIKSKEFLKDIDIENIKIGLSSEYTKENAISIVKIHIIKTIIRLSKEIELFTTNVSPKIIIENLANSWNLPSLSIDAANLVEKNMLYLSKGYDNEKIPPAVEVSANNVVEQLLRNTTNYMDVKEYLFRLNLILEDIKKIDKELDIKPLMDSYKIKCSILNEVGAERDHKDLSLNIAINNSKWAEHLLNSVSTKDLIIDIMKNKEINKEDLDLTTIFKQFHGAFKNLYIVLDSYTSCIKALAALANDYSDNKYFFSVGETLNYIYQEFHTDISEVGIEKIKTLISDEEKLIKLLNIMKTKLSLNFKLDNEFMSRVIIFYKKKESYSALLVLIYSLLNTIMGKIRPGV